MPLMKGPLDTIRCRYSASGHAKEIWMPGWSQPYGCEFWSLVSSYFLFRDYYSCNLLSVDLN